MIANRLKLEIEYKCDGKHNSLHIMATSSVCKQSWSLKMFLLQESTCKAFSAPVQLTWSKCIKSSLPPFLNLDS